MDRRTVSMCILYHFIIELVYVVTIIQLAHGNVNAVPGLPIRQPLFHSEAFGQNFKSVLELGMDGMCLEDSFRSDVVASGRHSSHIIEDFLRQEISGQPTDAIITEMKLVFPHAPNENVFKASYTPMTLPTIAEQSCAPRVKVQGYQVIETHRWDYPTERELVERIDSVLDSDHIVGIGLSSDSIDSGRQISTQEGHAVSIVGRRFGPESHKCEYLVRNSWGTSWADGGYKYVPRDHLLSGVENLAFLQKAKSN